MSLDNEWKRITGNPDNIIVSDSIRDLLDPSETGETILQRQQVSFTCTITKDGEEEIALNGTLRSYYVNGKEYRLGMELPMDDISTLMGWERIGTVTISNSSDMLTLEICPEAEDPDPEISIDIGSSLDSFSQAFVSIVISK